MEMDEGKWVKAQHDEIRLGDIVRVTSKDGPQTIIVEGKVTQMNAESYDGKSWRVEDFENFYESEFVPGRDGISSVLEKFIPAFEWPAKLGAVVKGKDEDGWYTPVLVKLTHDNNPDYHLWWSAEWGTVTAADLSGLEDLTVISEGVTVGG